MEFVFDMSFILLNVGRLPVRNWAGRSCCESSIYPDVRWLPPVTASILDFWQVSAQKSPIFALSDVAIWA